MTQGQHIIEALRGVDSGSLWGMAIARVVETPDADKVLDLVAQLRSQSRDNPPLMLAILGKKAFNAIHAL